MKYNAALSKQNNDFGRRLASARAAKGYTLKEMSARLAARGVELGFRSYHKWEQGVTVPNAYQLFALCEILEIKNPGFYFAGSTLEELNEAGLKKLSDYRDDLIASGRYTIRPQPPAGGIIRLPLSIMPASAGPGAFLDGESFEDAEFPKEAVPSGADFALKISGDSMEPIYSSGQTVFIKKCSALTPGDVGIFVYDGNGYIKVYSEQAPPEGDERYFDIDGAVRLQPVLISYNKKYSPIAVSPDAEFEIIGRVL